MPRLTNAERQKKYRERLKQNPEKYETLRKKHLERVKKNQKKINELNEDEKLSQREKWREDKKIKSKDVIKARNKNTNTTSCTLKKKIGQLALRNALLKKRNICLLSANNKLRQQNYRLRKTNSELKSIILGEADNDAIDEKENDDTIVIENSLMLTPTKRTDAMVDELMSTPENRETIKKEIFQLNVLSHSLKHEYQSQPQSAKNLLKKVVSNEICKKYKVSSKLSMKLGLKGRVRTIIKEKKKNRKENIAKELEDFFCRDDVSRATAGKKEFLTRKKTRMQKRYLLTSMKDLYKIYKNEGGMRSYSTFTRYRPFYVVPPTLNQRETCACIRHNNFSLKVEVLKKLGFLNTAKLEELLSQVACDIHSKTCMYGDCEDCKDKEIETFPVEMNKETVTWQEWHLKDHEYQKTIAGVAKTMSTKQYIKENVTGELNDLMMKFQDEAQKFKKHFYNIYHQQKMFRSCKENITEREAVVICDFSENYNCKYHEEIQAMHFGASRQSISLHTGVIYVGSEIISFCSMSPCLDHNPGAIWAHLDPVVKLIKDNFPLVSVLHFFTDGPTTQYKQKKNFLMMTEKVKEFELEHLTWNYFEASHGKGAADGIGGTIKWLLDQNVAYNVDIPDTQSAFEFLTPRTKIKIFYIAEDSIKKQQGDDNKDIITLKGTMQVHQIIITQLSSNDTKIFYRDVSCFCGGGLCDCYGVKEHTLVKELREEKPNRKRKIEKSRSKKQRCPSSDESLDTEIVYAESDDSPYEVEEHSEEDKPRHASIRRKITKKIVAAKSRVQCTGCEEDLISDVEDNDLKNIGCDKCPRWFHLKCTVLRGQAYEAIADEPFVCHVCFI